MRICTQTSALVIYGFDQRPSVTVGYDGSVVYGEGVDLDGAARTFWEAMARNAPRQPQRARRKAVPPA